MDPAINDEEGWLSWLRWGSFVGEMGGSVQRWVARFRWVGKLVDMGGKVARWLAKLRGGGVAKLAEIGG